MPEMNEAVQTGDLEFLKGALEHNDHANRNSDDIKRDFVALNSTRYYIRTPDRLALPSDQLMTVLMDIKCYGRFPFHLVRIAVLYQVSCVDLFVFIFVSSDQLFPYFHEMSSPQVGANDCRCYFLSCPGIAFGYS